MRNTTTDRADDVTPRVKLRERIANLSPHKRALLALRLRRESNGIGNHQLASDERQLVAYVVSAGGKAAEPQQLLEFLRKKLPEYMMPASIVFLDEMPRTPNGKIDTRALPSPHRSRSKRRPEFVAPRTRVEEDLARIWSEVLGVEKVGIHDNFGELGGHSLLAIRVISRLRDTFEVALPMRLLFETNSLSELAQAIEKEFAAMSGPQLPPLAKVARDGQLPLSSAQMGLWFLNTIEPDNPFYNISSPIRMAGPLDVKLLERSIGEVIRRHEVLRTTFPTIDGQPIQHIAPFDGYSLQVVDLRSLSRDDRERELVRLAREHGREPFDLSTGPLLRITLVGLDTKDHALLIAVHHMVADLWSAGLFLRELGQLYEAGLTGKTALLAELPIQYADFAVWERSLMKGAFLEKQLAYWQKQLSGVTDLLSLPLDRPRPAVQSYRGGRLPLALSREVSESLRALSRQQAATPFVTLLAAYQVLLCRYTGQTDICVASPVAYRNHSELENAIGYYMHTVVLRTDLSGDPTFNELVARVRDVAFEAQSHQDVPAEKVLETLRIERSLSRSPLTQIGFAVQNALVDSIRLPNLDLSFIDVHNETTKSDLALLMSETAETMSGMIEYATDLFDAATITRMFDAFRILLGSIVANPDQRISQLRMVETVEREEPADRVAVQSDAGQCIHQLVERQAAQTPNAIAVASATEHISFETLNSKANQLAHYLQLLGVGPNTLVGVSMERSPEMVMSVLAVLKAGGAYVPLDPAYPAERLAAMLDDARVAVLLTRGTAAESIPHDIARIVDVDRECAAIANECKDNPKTCVTGDDRIYAIFTSGSTGKPKLAAVRHRGFFNLMRWYVTEFELTAHDRTLLVSSFNFDLTQKNIFAPLITGGCLHLSPSDVYDPLSIRKAIDLNGITLLNCTPSAFQPLVDDVDESALAELRSLRYLFLGGEPILIRRLKKWTESPHFRAQIVNTYGPTECTDICAFYRLEHPQMFVEAPVPIGKAIPNTRLYVLDSSLGLLPIGAIGELCVGGEGVGAGYLNDGVLTESKFVDDPYSKKGGRLYRTGDLVRYQPGGSLEFVGRMDHQVKIRGYRIEPAEIEATVEQHPAIKQCVVVAREDGRGQQRLVGYIVSASEEKPATPELRQFLRTRLPDYMVPSSFVTLDALPLTPNGKVDRMALPPDMTEIVSSTPFAPPETPNEIALAAILQEVLGRDRIGIHDNFFELGGDSILAIQAISKANRAGLRLNPRQLFQFQTIAELAAVAGTGPVVRAEQGFVKGEVPLTPIQRHFFGETVIDIHHFNQSVLFEVHQPLDTRLLKRAVHKLLEHHDALRMRYQRREAGWLQRNAGPDEAASKPVFVSLDFSERADAELEQCIEKTAEELQRSLDIEKGPVIRFAYLNLGPTRHARLFIVMHHLIVDGLSWRILLEDLLSVYQQLHQGRSVDLPPKTTSFQQWAHRLKEQAQSTALLSERAYWQESTPKSVAALPVDFAGGSNTIGSVRTVSVSLTSEETQALFHEALAAYRTQINEVLLTALVRTCAYWTGRKSLLLGLEGHGRESLFDDVDVSRTIGWFTTIYPMFLQLPDSENHADALKSIKEQLRRVPNGGIGYGLLQGFLEDHARPEMTFNYLGRFDQMLPAGASVAIAKEATGPNQSLRAPRTQLLDVTGAVIGQQLHFTWSYSEALHCRTTIEALASQFLAELRSLVEHCKSADAATYTPSDFPEAALTQEDLDDVLQELDE